MQTKENIIRIDRQIFLDYLNSDLIITNAKEIITYISSVAQLALDAAEKGEDVILTDNGKDYSKVKEIETKDGLQEIKL